MNSNPLNSLTAISPVDGRYRNTTGKLADYFSEQALIRYRIRVEVEYFIALCELPLPQLADIDHTKFAALRALYLDFAPADAERVKEIESVTNHDVKAIEYIIKEKMDSLGLGLTRNSYISASPRRTSTTRPSRSRSKTPWQGFTTRPSKRCATNWPPSPTNGATCRCWPAPTASRPPPRRWARSSWSLSNAWRNSSPCCTTSRCLPNSAARQANFNAHRAAYPQYDWVAFANKFVGETLGLCRSQYTTQIEHYDNLAAIFDNMKRIDTILIDLCRDMWTYISMEYFKQQIKAGEVGSSAMPHKVNPIDFENAEGNFGIANAVFGHLASKLPVSRLQRDLTDSTVLRNIGVPIAHAAIALRSLMKGLNKVILNREALERDLANNWAVVAEGIQTILRREGYPSPTRRSRP